MLAEILRQRDFQDQERRLQEDAEALSHYVLCYPKFHCEPNSIVRTLLKCKMVCKRKL